MKKLALRLENLQVESFDTTTGRVGMGGTVMGNSVEPNDSEADCNTATNTEGPTCGAENTCGYYYDTCVESHDGSCYVCSHTSFCTADLGGCDSAGHIS